MLNKAPFKNIFVCFLIACTFAKASENLKKFKDNQIVTAGQAAEKRQDIHEKLSLAKLERQNSFVNNIEHFNSIVKNYDYFLEHNKMVIDFYFSRFKQEQTISKNKGNAQKKGFFANWFWSSKKSQKPHTLQRYISKKDALKYIAIPLFNLDEYSDESNYRGDISAITTQAIDSKYHFLNTELLRLFKLAKSEMIDEYGRDADLPNSIFIMEIALHMLEPDDQIKALKHFNSSSDTCLMVDFLKSYDPEKENPYDGLLIQF